MLVVLCYRAEPGGSPQKPYCMHEGHNYPPPPPTGYDDVDIPVIIAVGDS